MEKILFDGNIITGLLQFPVIMDSIFTISF